MAMSIIYKVIFGLFAAASPLVFCAPIEQAVEFTGISIEKIGLARRLTFKFNRPFMYVAERKDNGLELFFPNAIASKSTLEESAHHLSALPHVERTVCSQEPGKGIRCTITISPKHAVIESPKRLGERALMCELFKKKRLERIRHAPNGPLAHV